MKNRLLLFYFLLIIAFSLMAGQLVNLQVIQGERNFSLSEGNRIKLERIQAPRGIIYDRHHQPLVYNVPKDAPGESLRATPGAELTRDYLYGEILAHVLGYVDADYLGRAGLEKEYDVLLAGKEGGEIYEVDTQGKKLRRLERQEPVPGENLFLTIALDLQKAAYKALGNKKGAVVVSQPKTGEILALVSKPSFNPNVFSLREGPSATPGVESILNDPNQPLFNRATRGVYPPGSIFKIVTATAGLENGKITRETTILDTGEIRIGEYRYGNWYFDRFGRTEGELDVVRAIKRSNDIFFYRVGERVGARELVAWAKAFGLGQTAGYLPNPQAERWFLGNTYHLAIGQGKIGVTPLQVNLMANVIANGGKLCPSQLVKNTSDGGAARGGRLLRGEVNCQDLGINQETLALVREGMKEACQQGGTSLRFLSFDFAVGCKTGTAEFGDPEDRTHAWFTVFAPVDDPQISITVLVEAGGEGSTVAAPIAKEIMEKAVNIHPEFFPPKQPPKKLVD